MVQDLEHQPRGAGPAGLRESRQGRGCLARGLLRRPGGAVPRSEDRQQRACRHLAGATRQTQARLRPQRQRHPDRRQQHAADRRRRGTAAGLGAVGRGSATCRCWPTSRAGKTWAVDFASGKEGLLMAPAYAVASILQDTGLTLQDFDYYEIHEAFAAVPLCLLKAWESADYCRERLGLAGALGSIDTSQAQRQRRQRRDRSSVRGHRRAHSRHAGQAAGARSAAPARHRLRLHRRRHGRDRDPGACVSQSRNADGPRRPHVQRLPCQTGRASRAAPWSSCRRSSASRRISVACADSYAADGYLAVAPALFDRVAPRSGARLLAAGSRTGRGATACRFRTTRWCWTSPPPPHRVVTPARWP